MLNDLFNMGILKEGLRRCSPSALIFKSLHYLTMFLFILVLIPVSNFEYRVDQTITLSNIIGVCAVFLLVNCLLFRNFGLYSIAIPYMRILPSMVRNMII